MQDYMNPESNLLDKIVNHYIKLTREFKMDMKDKKEQTNTNETIKIKVNI